MILVFGYCCYIYGALENKEEPIEITEHDNCHNTRTHEAWIARKGNQLRCFMEHREYPHRVRGSHLENP